MRKMLLTVVASCALLAFAPATALAHQRGHHHHARHARRARVRHRTFGGDPGSGTSQGTSTGTSQNADTVQSFTGGVLTIMLSNGSTVSGQVTGDTNIECQAPQPSGTPPSGTQGSDQSNNNANNSGGDNSPDNSSSGDSSGDNSSSSDSSGDNSSSTSQSEDQGQGDSEDGGQSCSTTNLTPGTVVQEAVLAVSSAGSTWDKVDLMTQSSTPPAQPSGPSQPSDS